MFSCKLTDSAELRMYDHSHVEEVYAIAVANREHLSTWMPWADGLKGADETRAFIVRGLEQFARNDGFQCGIWEDNKFVGGAGFHRINRDNSYTEMGYWLAKDAQGRGLMTTACRKLITHAFDVWKLNKVEIRTAVGNTRSAAIPRRLGFIEEGTIRKVNKIGDTYHDLIVFGMLASEWRQRES